MDLDACPTYSKLFPDLKHKPFRVNTGESDTVVDQYL